MKPLIDFHTHNIQNDNSTKVYIIRNNHDLSPQNNIYYCFGLHPWDIGHKSLTKVFDEILLNISRPHFFGMGEIGLDKQSKAPFEIQLQLFREQVKFANENKIKTLILHNVKSYNESFQVLKEMNFSGNLILHAYNELPNTFQQFEKIFNTYISIGKNQFLSQNKIKSLHEIPLNKILFETDDHQEHQIHDVYKKYANILKVDLNTLVENHHKILKKLKQN